jgi:hypothetical protein
MESIEKLHERSHLDDDRWTLSDGRVMWYTNGEPNDPNAVNWGEQLRKIADEIEREIAERYMELPLDADGVPIHCGERMRLDDGYEGDVWLIGVFDIMMSDRTCFDWAKSYHVKPRTLEDVLREYRHDASVIYDDPNIGGEDRADALEGLDEKVAAEIREMMEVDE